MAASVNFSCIRPPCARLPAGQLGETIQQSIVLSKTQQLRTLAGPVAIFWDIENCPVPGEVNAEDVAGNIRMALRVHPAVKGAVIMFSAYGDFNQFPRRLREGFQRTGVNLIDVPNGKKDASDKAILVDMFLYALDNPPPSTILLISGDVDFAPALHKLGQRGFTVVLAVQAGVGVSSALCNSGRFVWDWPSVARGEGLVPGKASFGEEKLADSVGFAMGGAWHSSDDSDFPTEDEYYAYWRHAMGTSHNHGVSMKMSVATGMAHSSGLPTNMNGLMRSQCPMKRSPLGVPGSQNFVSFGLDCSTTQDPTVSVGQAIGTCQIGHTFANAVTPSSCSKALPNLASSHSYANNKHAEGRPWVQPGDTEGLKAQFMNLLKLNGGKLLLIRVPSEYCKHFGRPLYLSEYGSPKLVHLIERMADTLVVKGEGRKRMLHLKDSIRASIRHRRVRADSCLAAKEVRDTYKVESNRCYADIDRLGQGAEDSEACSDDEKACDLLETGDEDIQEHETLQFKMVADEQDYMAEVSLELFRQELQELLVSHACKILLASFPALYRQKFSRDLEVSSFGVEGLDVLLEKVQDLALVKEEQGTRNKFLVAKYGGTGHIL